jgi:hypothetical protein
MGQQMYSVATRVWLQVCFSMSMLSKKHDAIYYHRVREACAMATMRVSKERTEMNLSDLFKKQLPRPRHQELRPHIAY